MNLRSNIEEGSSKSFQPKNKGENSYKKLLNRVLVLNNEGNQVERTNICSQGQEYDSLEEEMLKPEEVYQSKKFRLKHKFDWKV